MVTKWDFDAWFRFVLKLKTDEKWSMGARKKNSGKKLSKNGTSTFGFDSVNLVSGPSIMSKTDEKWSPKANTKLFEVENLWEWSLRAKKNIEEKFVVKKRHFDIYSFDSVLKLKTDEKWSLGAMFFFV